MRLIADLHIHSRFSRATSPEMDLPALARWANVKGIDILGSGDFTHPQWFNTLEAGLVPAADGLYLYEETLFMLTAEVAAIWSQAGWVRKVHLLVLVPSLEAAARINYELARIGNLAADGRPMLGISAKSLVEAIWSAEPNAEVIPAHAWTPWFSVFGSRSGFDSLEECFGEYTERIFAIETGLSSDPAMNWRLSCLDEIALVSNSDAHSPAKLGREVTLFDLPAASYDGIVAAMKERDPSRFLGTIEFFPQEGKYHYDGHRACGVVLAPREAMVKGNRCPVCGKPLTIGVMHRVEELADRSEGEGATGKISYRSLVPLEEVIAQAIGFRPGTKSVIQEYERLITHFGSEFRILLDLPEDELRKATSPRVLQAIRKVRAGELDIEPGYDGVYGKVTIPLDAEEQLSLL
jgi:uncharacterized protein (TIGR00375 family)